MSYLARITTRPRPVMYASLMPIRPQSVAPVGKSGPGRSSITASRSIAGLSMIGNQRIAHLSQVMRRHRRRHPDRDPPRAVDQQVRELPGQHPRLLVLLVVIRLKIDRVELDVLEHLGRDRAELGLRVPHRRRRQTVNAAEIALRRSPASAANSTTGPFASASDKSSSRRAGDTASSSRRRCPRTCSSRRRGSSPRSRIATRIRRCDGLSPSRTSGKRPADDHGHRVIEIAFLELFLDVQGRCRKVCFRRRNRGVHVQPISRQDRRMPSLHLTGAAAQGGRQRTASSWTQ